MCSAPRQLTVAIPVYNGMPYLPAAIESILNQSYQDFELLIVDDGSTDDSTSYIASLKDPRIRIIRQVNAGPGAAGNTTFRECRTEFYARMDADDIVIPGRFEKQLAFLRSHPDVVLVGTHVDFVVDGKIFRGSRMPAKHDEIVSELSRGYAAICQPSMMIRVDAARNIGGYRGAGAGEDYDFCLRISSQGKLANIPEVLHLYRIHRASTAISNFARISVEALYARECFLARQHNVKEPLLSEFRETWKNRSVWIRTRERVLAWSNLQYRLSLFDRAAGKHWLSLLRLAVVACIRPNRAILAIMRMLHDWRGKQTRSNSSLRSSVNNT